MYLGFDTGFPHRLVRDETQERRRSGRVTEQQKKCYFNCKIENHTSMDISVVVPLYNEEESLPELFAWIERVMNANGFHTK